MPTSPSEQLLSMARLIYGIDARGDDVEQTSVLGRPAIEHLVDAYDALTEADWPTKPDPTWPVFTAVKIVVVCFHLGASVETSEVNGRIVLRYLIDAVGDYNALESYGAIPRSDLPDRLPGEL